MQEAGVVVSTDGEPIYWHLPNARSSGALPDDAALWNVLRDNASRLAGVAHSHPGSGVPGPSYEDVTTFAALEAGLGKRFKWWIISSDSTVVCEWVGPDRLSYVAKVVPEAEVSGWLDGLRSASDYNM